MVVRQIGALSACVILAAALTAALAPSQASAGGIQQVSIDVNAATVEEVDAFNANPQQLLADFPAGGDALANAIAALVLANPDLLYKIVPNPDPDAPDEPTLLDTANELQKAAIAQGLRKAMDLIATGGTDADIEESQQISVAVVSTGDQTLIDNFFAGESLTAAIAGAGGTGGGAGGGGLGGGGGGGGTAFTSTGTGGNSSFSISSGGSSSRNTGGGGSASGQPDSTSSL
jgi:hypothetical protein